MIEPSKLTDFTSEQLKTFAYVIRAAGKKAYTENLFQKYEDLFLFWSQIKNAQKIVEEREKIEQS